MQIFARGAALLTPKPTGIHMRGRKYERKMDAGGREGPGRRGEAGMTRKQKPESVRERLASMITDAFRLEGLEVVPFDGENLITVSGYWKQQDVYRWESVGLNLVNPETRRKIPMSVSGWDTMTRIVRSGGVELTRIDLTMYEADLKSQTAQVQP